jgi:ClpP class serine protease
MMAEMASKAITQVRDFVYYLLEDKMEKTSAKELAELLSSGNWTHDYPIDSDQLKEMGLPVKVGLAEDIYSLMELYPQPAQRRPSVQFIPLPYGKREREQGGK